MDQFNCTPGVSRYMYVYTWRRVHAWSEIAVGGRECLNVDNHLNDNIPNSAPMDIICAKRVPQQPFSSVSRNAPPMIQSVQYIRTTWSERGVTFMSIIRSRASRQSGIAGFLYLTLFRSDFASFVREISSYTI